MIVMSRVESVCRARWVRSNSSRVRPMRSAALGMSLGGSTFTLGLGVLHQASSRASRCSRSRTLVMYSSSRRGRRSRGWSAACWPDRGRRRGCSGRPRGGSPGPGLRRAGRRGTTWRTPSTATWMPAPVRRCASRTGQRLRPTGPGWESASGRRCARPRIDRARSRCESRAVPRPGTPVRKLAEAWWANPGLMPACDSPETTVKSSRKSLRTSR